VPSAYPGALDTTSTFPTTIQDDTDSKSGTDLGLSTTTGFLATLLNNLDDAMLKVQGENGVNPSGTFIDIAARLAARSTVRLTADSSGFTTQVLANLTGMSFSVAASSDYWFRFAIPVTLGTARGVGVGVTCPASPTSIFYRVAIGNVTATSETIGFGFASAAAVISAASATTNGFVMIEGTLANGVNAGTLQVQLRQGSGATAVNVVAKKGAFGEMYLN
jgi:hypothetical protein